MPVSQRVTRDSRVIFSQGDRSFTVKDVIDWATVRGELEPIWAEFMNRAAKYRPYRDATAFRMPPGIESVEICPESGERAGPACPERSMEVFVAGTAPAQECQRHSIASGQ